VTEESSHLVVERDGAEWTTLPLNVPVLTIGRAPDNNLTLPDPLVSRHHAELRLSPEGPVLTDLDSSNGTFINSVQLMPHQPQLLATGAVVQIGPFSLVVHVVEQTQAAVEPEPQEDAPPPPPPTAAKAKEPAPEEPKSEEPAPEEPKPKESKPKSPKPKLPMVRPRAPAVRLEARPLQPPPPLRGPSSRYMGDLPIPYQDSDFLGRFLQIFESIWEPLEQRQDHVEMYFDPRSCPAPFLPWLTSWLGLPFQGGWPEGRLRRLLAEATDLYRWRGTNYGLTHMLEVCAGVAARVTEEPDQPFVIHVEVAGNGEEEIDRELVEALIQTHKPAHAGYVLDVSA
jgi:phage tail-like protein